MDAGCQFFRGKKLGFVKDDNSFNSIMQLSGPSWSGREHGFKNLKTRCSGGFISVFGS